jgi:hypothetical protein
MNRVKHRSRSWVQKPKRTFDWRNLAAEPDATYAQWALGPLLQAYQSKQARANLPRDSQPRLVRVEIGRQSTEKKLPALVKSNHWYSAVTERQHPKKTESSRTERRLAV